MNKLLALILISVLATGCATGPSSSTTAPLPGDVSITTPEPSLPPTIKGLSGKWAGKWLGLAGGQQQDTLLVVEKMDANQATVIYSQGTHSRLQAFSRRTTASVSPGKLEFTLDGRAPSTFRYELQANGSLKATMESRGFTAVATLSKVSW